MDAPARRASAASPTDGPALQELHTLVDRLVGALPRSSTPTTIDTILTQCDCLRRIRQLLIDSADFRQLKEAYRHAKGFHALVDTLRSVSAFYNPATLSKDEQTDFFELLKAVLAVLSEALSDHPGNRRFFSHKVEEDGWKALEQALVSTGVGGGFRDNSTFDDAGQEQLFGCLVAFALGEENMARIFRDMRGVRPNATNGDPTEEADQAASADEGVGLGADASRDPAVGNLRERLNGFFSGNEVLQNPEILPVIINMWLMLFREGTAGSRSPPLSTSILLVLERVIGMSAHNKLAAHGTGVLRTLLRLLFDAHQASSERLLLQRLADDLIAYGINDLEDARYLYRLAAESEEAASFLLAAIKSSRQPPFIQLDMSLHGYTSVELRDLGRAFPPTSPNGGYTVSAWIRIDKFDDNYHTTIFGAYDATQTCFVLVYLEKGSRHLILQTSMTSSRPSVRFKSTVFKENLWYHVTIVHRRPKIVGPGRANLFINGEFAEHVKCNFPSNPPNFNSSTESFAAFSSSNARYTPIEAFLGTPHAFSPRLGRNVVSTKLSLASFHLFQDALSDELVAVYHKLGPRYSGNFQDCLGSFLTYHASADLNLYNELLHPAKEERSEILSAMRHKAGAILPESRILLSISPTSVMDDDDRNHIDESELVKCLSRDAAKNLRHYTRTGGHPIAINAAVPSINDALCQVNGVAILAGDPVVVVPQSLDNASWRVGGCAAIGLKLVELAETRNALTTAIQIVFESVHDNWRNSEAMEREHGFAVLAALLRDKMGLGSVFGRSTTGPIEDSDFESLSYECLQLILRFVGFEESRPQESKIINPLAYRALLIDFDLWRKCPADTQKLYYRQFECFAKDSKYHVFNSKRLTRMRIIKRLLDALKGENFTQEVFPHFLSAFKALIKCSVSSDILRSTALFITFALQESRTLANRPLRSSSSARQLRRGPTPPLLLPHSTPSTRPISPNLQAQAEKLSRKELGIRVLEAYAAFLCDDASATEIKRFAKTVTNKWLVYLFAESDARIIVPSFKILARLLVVQGPHFVKKFSRDGGFINLEHRLRSWWNTPALWTICFAILFGADVGKINFERDFDLYNLMDAFAANGQITIAYPDILPVMTEMLETGLRVLVKQQESIDRPVTSQGENGVSSKEPSASLMTGHTRKRSMSLESELASREPQQPSSRQNLVDYAAILHTIIQFLADVHMKSAHFREFAIASSYVQELLFVLYPVIVTSDSVSAETELHSRGSALTFEGEDVLINPHTASNDQQPSIVRTTPIEAPRSPSAKKATPLRRGSSFILISSDKAKYPSTTARLHTVMSPRKSASVDLKVGNAVVQALLELVIGVFLDQLLHKKDFSGFGLYLKVPPGFQEHQAYFESYVLLHSMQTITNELQLRQELLSEPRVLTNLARYVLHMAEAVFEGWFMNGAEALLDFVGTILDHLSQPEIAQLKGVRLCIQAISTIRTVFFRVALLRLSELDEPDSETEAITFLHKMSYWQTIILSPEHLEGNYLRLVCYLLYTKLVSSNGRVRAAAADFWRLMLVQKPAETSQILNQTTSSSDRMLFTEFMKLTELDNDAFLEWVDNHRSELDGFFFGAMSKIWEDFVTEENRKTEESAKNRVSKRRERLKQWHTDEAASENAWHRHEVSTTHWRANIFAAERLKHQRALQDQQDNLTFLASTLEKLDQTLREPCALFESEETTKWQLDETEGRNRMRLRILPDNTGRAEYQPKRKESEAIPKGKLSLITNVPQIASPETAGASPNSAHPGNNGQNGRNRSVSQSSMASNVDDDFEMVADPNEGEDGFEDKNRKVMRSLQQGDQVQNVFNVSRIVGLEACEGLLILGKDSLYLLDNFFQRSDGEIIRVWQAPPEERDTYVQMISGKKATERKPQMIDGEQTTRHWKWAEVISISKRRFLFRDVAIEIFFTDGRSYLLTAVAPKLRDELHAKLLSRAPQVISPSALQSEDAWRLESLRTPEEAPPTLTSKWANVFNPMAQNPATKKWMRGEISNFHYLMLVNTMAGRTFNDLTQYPVFPWVLADYTSEELDLNDPKTFRDLSKPMGAQSTTREAEFKERYQTFAEMSDGTNPVFHYGTHYSSAMIVTSYLIRLQPFVQSYLLLQGGSFDHADRLFYSIENAWQSASKTNMTDVRELIPEFFYLPEFFRNTNGYNFGVKQGSGEKINDVVLPPWAKGDPEIFITKHREALESPYVSKHLHKWIDLVFGYKQQGDAAVEATNVFHYLSYHGAKDVDNIEDPVERLATIGIIHNFGQTPHQVFQKPHPPQGEMQKPKRLDTAAEFLTRLPFTLLDARERVATLTYHPKQDRILCSAAFRINIPPAYDRYMEWGFTDGSVRFYATDSKKLIGLWEHLHQGQISCATFVDGKTLITAGTDCTLSVWNVVSNPKTVDLVPKVCFFGHRKPVAVLATSRAFSTFLSADSDGLVFLWDLNRSEFVRNIGNGNAPVQCARINNVNGHIVLCTGSKLLLYTLNGGFLLEQDVCDTTDADDIIYSCAFYEGVGNEWLERELLFTGHRKGVVNVWNKSLTPGTGQWTLQLVSRLNHIDPSREDGGNFPGAITYILPMAQTVYTGDEDGKVGKCSTSGIAYKDMADRDRLRKSVRPLRSSI